jgi:hypothetical protein
LDDIVPVKDLGAPRASKDKSVRRVRIAPDGGGEYIGAPDAPKGEVVRRVSTAADGGIIDDGSIGQEVHGVQASLIEAPLTDPGTLAGRVESRCDCKTGLDFAKVYPKGSPDQEVTITNDTDFARLSWKFPVNQLTYKCDGSGRWWDSPAMPGGRAHVWHVKLVKRKSPWHCFRWGSDTGTLILEAFNAQEDEKIEYHGFQTTQIADNMIYSDCDGKTADGDKIPAEFGGLWWMDGNPAGVFETVASFGHAHWRSGPEECKRSTLSAYTEEEREKGIVRSPHGDEVPCQGLLLFPFYADRIWAMPNTWMAKLYAQVGTIINQNMEFVCGGASADNLTVCKLGASQGLVSSAWNQLREWFIADPFNIAWKFSMVKVNSDSWIRYSFGDSHQYYLKRIINCDGKEHTQHMKRFLSNGSAEPDRQADVFGNGGDDRDYVAAVPEELFVIKW